MKVKIKKVEDHFPEWIKIGEEYEYTEGNGNWVTIINKDNDKSFIISPSCLEKALNPLQIKIPESQLKAFQKAAILAKEYCQEALVEHEKKVGRSILRKEIILEEGLKKDLTFLENVVECFEGIFPEDYE